MNSCLSQNSLFNHFLQNKECNYPNGWNTCKIGHFLQRRQNIGSNLDVADPTKIVFAIMVSSLYKKWSCIIHLLPCASITAEVI